MISSKNLMILIILLCSLAAIAVITSLIVKKKRESRRNNESWPFYARRLMSKPEQILYYRLTEALPEYIILAQVQLSRVLGVKKGHAFNEWNNRINRMSLDFVICRKDASIVAAIELDDKSHEREERRTADAKKDKALKSANIPILRWKNQELPNHETIRKKIND